MGTADWPSPHPWQTPWGRAGSPAAQLPCLVPACFLAPGAQVCTEHTCPDGQTSSLQSPKCPVWDPPLGATPEQRSWLWSRRTQALPLQAGHRGHVRARLNYPHLYNRETLVPFRLAWASWFFWTQWILGSKVDVVTVVLHL